MIKVARYGRCENKQKIEFGPVDVTKKLKFYITFTYLFYIHIYNYNKVTKF